jgi:hypothetical protein
VPATREIADAGVTTETLVRSETPSIFALIIVRPAERPVNNPELSRRAMLLSSMCQTGSSPAIG